MKALFDQPEYASRAQGNSPEALFPVGPQHGLLCKRFGLVIPIHMDLRDRHPFVRVHQAIATENQPSGAGKYEFGYPQGLGGCDDRFGALHVYFVVYGCIEPVWGRRGVDYAGCSAL